MTALNPPIDIAETESERPKIAPVDRRLPMVRFDSSTENVKFPKTCCAKTWPRNTVFVRAFVALYVTFNARSAKIPDRRMTMLPSVTLPVAPKIVAASAIE